MTNNKSVRFTINFVEKTITGTKASFTKASKGYGEAYEELAAKIAHHPDFTLIVKEPKKHTKKAKRTYEGLDFKFMEDYISILENAEQITKEYNAEKKMATDSKISVYPFVKKWFLGKFGTEEQPFDMEEAKKAISDYRIAKAEQSVAVVFDKQSEDHAELDLTLVS